MWHGRFKEQTADLMNQYSESISFDWQLFQWDIQGSLAHACVLEAAGIISAEERAKIAQGLLEIRAEIERGEFQFDRQMEDIHMNIEAELTRRIGEAGAKLHTARSRNDQVALDLRLYILDAASQVQDGLRRLQGALVALGEKYQDVVIPGYTHLQRAQPVYFAHHLLAYVEMLERDFQRFRDSRARTAVLPLGSGALAGSTIPLPREVAAQELGFEKISQNSMDAVSDRDFACEFLFNTAMLGLHLSRLSEDIILWTTEEFGFAHLSDAYTTGSSMMPQKKNPDAAELTRGASGRLIGNLVNLLVVLKGLPMTYNRDLQHDKEPVFDSFRTAKTALLVFAEMLPGLEIHEQKTAAAIADPALLATDLADYLVLKGLPFRQAHEVVGKLVALALERKSDLRKLSLEDYQKTSALFEKGIHDILDSGRSLAARKAIGAPAPENVKQQLAQWKKQLAE